MVALLIRGKRSCSSQSELIFSLETLQDQDHLQAEGVPLNVFTSKSNPNFSLTLRDRSIHRESMYPKQARCMNAKSSLTTAYTKLGCSYTDERNPMYMPIKLSKMMLNPVCSNPCQVIFASCS